MKTFRVLFWLSLIFSCTPSVPDHVLPQEKMQAVVWDLMQADEMARHFSMVDTGFLGLAKHVDYYQKIFAVHKVNKEDFVRSLGYYESNPSQLKTILDSLQKFGERLQTIDSAKKATPTIVDSLKQLTVPSKQRQ